MQLTVLLSELLGLLVRDVPLCLQVGFVPDEDYNLRAHSADGGETPVTRRRAQRGGSAPVIPAEGVGRHPNQLLHNSVDAERRRQKTSFGSSNVIRPVVR